MMAVKRKIKQKRQSSTRLLSPFEIKSEPIDVIEISD